MIPELKDKELTTLIGDSLQRSMSYTEYRNLVSELVDNESTTGSEQSNALVNYTMLNDRRMKRWDKTVKISEAANSEVEKFGKNTTWLVLTESWCGDAAHIMPVMNKIANLSDHINFRVVLRDENEDLMDAFLTNGGRSIPKLIAINNSAGEVVGSYGPRPSTATDLVNAYKEEHGSLTPEFKEDLQRWYNKDKGQTAIKDLLGLLD